MEKIVQEMKGLFQLQSAEPIKISLLVIKIFVNNFPRQLLSKRSCFYFVLFFLIPFKLNAKENLNIILISIDTLRPNYLGFYGNNPSPSPFLDYLSENSVIFKEARTPVPLTLPSHLSIFTGLYPHNHKVRDNGRGKLQDGIKTITKFLKEKGFQTGAVIGSYVLSSRFGLSNGFDIYDDLVYKDGKEKLVSVFQERDANVVKENALNIFKKFEKEKPFFLFIHFFDVHAPYIRHYNLKNFNEYEEEILWVDNAIKSLFHEIDTPNTLWIIFSDHGEAFGEHNEYTHGFLTYDTTLKVLLMFYFPKYFNKKIIDKNVSLIDVFPTIADLFNEKIPCDGVSLLPLIRSEELPQRNLFFESYYSAINFGTKPIYGVISNNLKIIFPEPVEIYDLKNDRDEKINIYIEKKEEAEKSKKVLKKIIEFQEFEKMDNETIKTLRSLGYIARPVVSKEKNISPKELFNLYKEISKARDNFFSGREEFPFSEYEKFLSKFEEASFLSLELALAYFKNKEKDKAIKWLLQALRYDPELIEAWHNLGNIYYVTGNFKEAEKAYMKVVELDEDFPYSYLSLGKIYYDRNEIENAFNMWKKFISLCPNDENVKIIKKIMGTLNHN